jgi:hypothetical protein
MADWEYIEVAQNWDLCKDYKSGPLRDPTMSLLDRVIVILFNF